MVYAGLRENKLYGEMKAQWGLLKYQRMQLEKWSSKWRFATLLIMTWGLQKSGQQKKGTLILKWWVEAVAAH